MASDGPASHTFAFVSRGLRLQLECADVARPKDGDRPAIEGGDPVDSESLRRSHQERIGQARTMLRDSLEQLDRPGQIGRRGRDEADRTAGHRTHERERGSHTQLALEERVQLAERQGTEQEWLIRPAEPGQGRGVIEVRPVGRGEHDARIEKDRHPRGSALAGVAATDFTSNDRAPIERQSPMGAPANREERQLRCLIVLGQEGLEGRRDDRGLGRASSIRVAVHPIEQVGVGQDGRSTSRHMPAYMTGWRGDVKPCDHPRTP